jgi:hypothetical protein
MMREIVEVMWIGEMSIDQALRHIGLAFTLPVQI